MRDRFQAAINIRGIDLQPPFPMIDRLPGRPVIRFFWKQPVIDRINDHSFLVMFKRDQKIRQHAVDPLTLWIAALMTWDMDPLRSSPILADDTLAVVSVDQQALPAHGTKEFAAVI